MYAMVATRANIAIAVNIVCQFMAKAGPPHWMVVKRIMRYLKGILDFKSCIGGKAIAFRGFWDVDWTEIANDQRSTTWYVFLIGVGVISWKCKIQPSIAL